MLSPASDLTLITPTIQSTPVYTIHPHTLTSGMDAAETKEHMELYPWDTLLYIPPTVTAPPHGELLEPSATLGVVDNTAVPTGTMACILLPHMPTPTSANGSIPSQQSSSVRYLTQSPVTQTNISGHGHALYTHSFSTPTHSSSSLTAVPNNTTHPMTSQTILGTRVPIAAATSRVSIQHIQFSVDRSTGTLSNSSPVTSDVPSTSNVATNDLPVSRHSRRATVSSIYLAMSVTSLPQTESHTLSPRGTMATPSSLSQRVFPNSKSGTLATSVKTVGKNPGTASDSHLLSSFPLWGWVAAATIAFILAAVVVTMCTVFAVVRYRRKKGSYNLTDSEREDPHGSLSSVIQRSFIPTGVYGRDLVSSESNGARGGFRAAMSSKLPSTTKRSKKPSQVKRSSSETSLARIRRPSYLGGSLSRSSINSLRVIDMKLDLVYSPEPTQTSTTFSSPSPAVPNHDRDEEDKLRTKEHTADVHKDEASTVPPTQELQESLVLGDENESRSDTTNSDMDMIMYAV